MNATREQNLEAYRNALATVMAMVTIDETADAIAAFVIGIENTAAQVSVSHAIENAAAPGSLAAAVFDILCNA